MSAYLRRYTTTPPTTQLVNDIEQIAIIDGVAADPAVGEGTGTLCVIGEYEDGPFNVPTEVFGENNQNQVFGTLGYTYGGQLYQNASARRHLGEDWNGNGYLKGRFLRPQRKVVVRVDTSVGSIVLSPLANVRSIAGPFRLQVGDQLGVDVDAGGVVLSTAIAAAPATVNGVVFPGVTSGFTGGEQITAVVDGGAVRTITFAATDQTPAQVAARINNTFGYTAAVDNGGGLDWVAVQEGTGGSLVIGEITAGALAAIGLVAGTTPGTGNVANLAAVTAAEIAPLVNAPGAADTDAQGRLIVYSPTAIVGSIQIAAGTMATALGLPTGTLIIASDAPDTRIPAGTRIRNVGGDEWVTMQTVNVAEGQVDTQYTIPVRPALDNGTSTGAAANTVNDLVDVPTEWFFSADNPAALGAALTENQLDVAYETAFDSTLNTQNPSAQIINRMVCARYSDAVTRKGRQNAIDASNNGNLGRVFYARGAQGVVPSDQIAAVNNYRSDRLVFTGPSWLIRYPEIAAVGSLAGGVGFTDDGIITMGADGPLAYIDSVLPPEENPAQDTGLLTFVLGLEPVIDPNTGAEVVYTREVYTAFKRAGICAPRVDERGVPTYQSGVTSSLESGRLTIKRRKFADFAQDSLARLALPFAKKLITNSLDAGLDGELLNFLSNLDSPNEPDNARIEGFGYRNITSETPGYEGNGVTARKIEIRMRDDARTIVLDTEIGENVTITDATE